MPLLRQVIVYPRKSRCRRPSVFCFEDWPSAHGRAYYSVFVIVVQYCLPILTLSIAHARICNKSSTAWPKSSTAPSSRCRKKGGRMRRTNTLLVSIALSSVLVAAPHLFQRRRDLHNPFGDDTESMLIVYSVCHMAGMSSACSNPCSTAGQRNFRKEFLESSLCCAPSAPPSSTPPPA
ncbi:neuropeptide F receptor-like [Penaeus monodon]|uniref:neuropeptide F receptor-like n=1 Tax=Penaeus monodon TaxID=6687 RepID=UPI0018A765F8|nr:neuropeptide F receptor-like [Penaeus monodon]